LRSEKSSRTASAGRGYKIGYKTLQNQSKSIKTRASTPQTNLSLNQTTALVQNQRAYAFGFQPPGTPRIGPPAWARTEDDGNVMRLDSLEFVEQRFVPGWFTTAYLLQNQTLY
jgi:hypothetical protein